MARAEPGRCVSLSRLAADLGTNRTWLSGFVAGMGIVLRAGPGHSRCVRARDIPRIRRQLDRMRSR